MADLEPFAYGPAAEFYENEATSDEQDELDRIVGLICDNPGIDHQVKFWFPVPPVVFSLYAAGGWWVVYHQRSDFTIGILNIGRGERTSAHYRAR